MYLDLANHPLQLGLFLALGFGVGMLSGLLGVGGGIVMTPVLHILGMDLPHAVGTTLTQMVASSLSGSYKHFKQGNISLAILLFFGLPGILGVYLGKKIMLAVSLDDSTMTWFTLAYGLFLVFLAFAITRRQGRKIQAEKKRSYFWSVGPQIEMSRLGIRIPVLQTVLFGCSIGLISGLTGLGGGFFFVPVFCLVLGFPLKNAVGTSLGIVVLTSSMGAINYVAAGMSDLKLALVLAIGSMLGSYVGASLNGLVSVESLKKQFAFLVFAAAISVILKFFDHEYIGITILIISALSIIFTASYQVVMSLRART